MNPKTQDIISKEYDAQEMWKRITDKVYSDPKLKAIKDKWLKEMENLNEKSKNTN